MPLMMLGSVVQEQPYNEILSISYKYAGTRVARCTFCPCTISPHDLKPVCITWPAWRGSVRLYACYHGQTGAAGIHSRV